MQRSTDCKRQGPGRNQDRDLYGRQGFQERHLEALTHSGGIQVPEYYEINKVKMEGKLIAKPLRERVRSGDTVLVVSDANVRVRRDYLRSLLTVLLRPGEDVAIVESVQRGLSSLGYDQGRYVVDKQDGWYSESALHRFHMQILQALAGDFELAWCTGWEEKANEYLPAVLGSLVVMSTSTVPAFGV